MRRERNLEQDVAIVRDEQLYPFLVRWLSNPLRNIATLSNGFGFRRT
jgi:2-oxoglutarate dehydrogenase complex dehydrogenase (E1) component-like enzyme